MHNILSVRDDAVLNKGLPPPPRQKVTSLYLGQILVGSVHEPHSSVHDI